MSQATMPANHNDNFTKSYLPSSAFGIKTGLPESSTSILDSKGLDSLDSSPFKKPTAINAATATTTRNSIKKNKKKRKKSNSGKLTFNAVGQVDKTSTIRQGVNRGGVTKGKEEKGVLNDDLQVDEWLYGESVKVEGEGEEQVKSEETETGKVEKVEDESENDANNEDPSSTALTSDGPLEKEGGEEALDDAGDDDDEEVDDDDEDSDDSGPRVIIDLNAAPTADIAGQAPFAAKRPAGPPPDKKGKFSVDDFEGTGTINGVPAQDFSLDSIEEKPWRKPGADLTDYFNYGFTEETWRAYTDRQKRLRYESGNAMPMLDRERKHHPQGGSHNATIPIVGSDNSKYGGPPNVIFPKKYGMQDRQKDGQRIPRSREEHRENTIQVMTADRREYSRKTFDMPPPPMGPPPFDMSVPPPPFPPPPDMYRGPPEFFNHPPPQYYPEEHIDYEEQQWMDNAWDMKGPGPSSHHVVPLTKMSNLPPPPGESDDFMDKRTPPRKDEK